MTDHTTARGIPDRVSRQLDRLERLVDAPDTGGQSPDSDPLADQFEARILWLSAKPMVPGRQYAITLGGVSALCTPERPKYRLEEASQRRLAAKTLAANQTGVANISVDTPLRFEPYTASRELGRFLLADRDTGAMAGAGLIHFALRRSTNIRPQSMMVNAAARAALKSHAPCVLWFTGLSGAGKSTIANIVEHSLNAMGCHTIMLDGDNVRHGLNRDLGFTEADRAENIRRIAEVAKLMTDAGLITLVSFISPFASERNTARELIGADKFVEVFVDTPLEVAEARDVKGLYKKARQGDILNFTGIDSPYEAPDHPELRLPAGASTPDECAALVMELLQHREFIR